MRVWSAPPQLSARKRAEVATWPDATIQLFDARIRALMDDDEQLSRRSAAAQAFAELEVTSTRRMRGRWRDAA